MKLFPETRTQPESRAVTFSDLWARDEETSGIVSSAGEVVNEDTSLALSAVYGSVRILTHGVAQAAIRTTRGVSPTESPTDNPTWVDDPGRTLFFGDILQQIMHSLLMRGNAYIATLRRPDGTIQELRVLDPDLVSVHETAAGVRYKIGTSELLSPFDIHHIRGATLKPGSLVAESPIRYWRESVGLGLAAQRYGAELFNNGGLPGAVVELPEAVESPSRAALGLMRKQWDEMYAGKGNRAKLAVLTRGATFKSVSITPENAQFLGTRGFQIADVARYFGVPPHLLQDATNSTSWGSGLSEQSQNYLIHSLRPWVIKLEQSFTWLARSEQTSTQARTRLNIYLTLDHLTEGTFSERVDSYSKLFMSGGIKHDEYRAEFGFPPLPNGAGDRFYVPANLEMVKDDQQLQQEADAAAAQAQAMADAAASNEDNSTETEDDNAGNSDD